jgi:hypothetical protein
MSKSVLNEYCQKNGKQLPKYMIVDRVGSPHTPLFTVRCTCDKLSVISSPQCTRKLAENCSASRMYIYFTNLDQSLPIEDQVSEIPIDVQTSAVIYTPSQVTVFIDGDNVHEALDWILEHRPLWKVNLFLVNGTVGKRENSDNLFIYYSRSNLRDSTDIAIMLTVFSEVSDRCNYFETTSIVIVSRDKIFKSFASEVCNERIKICENIQDLLEI